MTVELTTEEKTAIIQQHLKSIAYSEYNATLSLAEAQAVASPSAESVASLTDQIADLAAQKQILVTELASL
jgi:hypothetical protein